MLSKSSKSCGSFEQNTIAIIYDFDGTLSPKPMQEYTVLPKLGISGEKFWRRCEKEAKKYRADKMLTYMRRLVEELAKRDKNMGRGELQELGKKILYFDGVKNWFSYINHYVKEKSSGNINIKHYIISAGLKEILNGISIKDKFSNIFACEYYFDDNNKAFPSIVVNDTNKTQFLFRINKGIEDINDSINIHMNKKDRPIPFSNMVYIGDGDTDVPCMALTKENGGFALAVYPPKNSSDANQLKTCKRLLKDKRIDYYLPADYTKNSKLTKKIKLILDYIIAGINLARDQYDFKNNKK